MRLKAAILALAALVAIGTVPAKACGFHGGPVGELDLAYPGSLSVAVAVSDAKGDGLLPKLDPTRSALGYPIAQRRLEALAAALRTDQAKASDGSFSLVLVGPRLWTTVVLKGDSVTAKVHDQGPASGRPVVMTHFLVIDAILRGQVEITNALERGMIRIDRDPERKTEALLVASLSPLAKSPDL